MRQRTRCRSSRDRRHRPRNRHVSQRALGSPTQGRQDPRRPPLARGAWDGSVVGEPQHAFGSAVQVQLILPNSPKAGQLSTSHDSLH